MNGAAHESRASKEGETAPKPRSMSRSRTLQGEWRPHYPLPRKEKKTKYGEKKKGERCEETCIAHFVVDVERIERQRD